MNVLILCTGNSCRSILGEATFNHLAPAGWHAVSAAGEECPAYLGPVLRAHWGVEDPAHATGTDEEIDAAFMHAYRTLRKRIETFLALPLEELKNDRARLKAELDRIGEVQA